MPWPRHFAGCHAHVFVGMLSNHAHADMGMAPNFIML